mmetsp:Transcript_17635/g.42772  ORF Transcript_17635/g.42772 Transcript_17635/m.42772 type:complete len:200 (+) Transcript_17635:6782-7381(+)
MPSSSRTWPRCSRAESRFRAACCAHPCRQSSRRCTACGSSVATACSWRKCTWRHRPPSRRRPRTMKTTQLSMSIWVSRAASQPKRVVSMVSWTSSQGSAVPWNARKRQWRGVLGSCLAESNSNLGRTFAESFSRCFATLESIATFEHSLPRSSRTGKAQARGCLPQCKSAGRIEPQECRDPKRSQCHSPTSPSSSSRTA